MSTVNTTGIFPSTKFISTDSVGDLQEVLGSAEVPNIDDTLTHDGVTYSATGDSGIVVTITEGASSDAISYDSVNKVLSIDLTGGVSSRTQGDIESLYANASTDVTNAIQIAVASSATNLATTLSTEPLTGGQDYVAPTSGDLEANSDYILIKRTDLYDLEDSEKNDGRKFIWGVINKASDVWAGLGDAPDNLTISKTTPSSVDGGTALQQTYTIRAKYAVSGLDLKDES